MTIMLRGRGNVVFDGILRSRTRSAMHTKADKQLSSCQSHHFSLWSQMTLYSSLSCFVCQDCKIAGFLGHYTVSTELFIWQSCCGVRGTWYLTVSSGHGLGQQCIRFDSSDRTSHEIFNITLCVSVHNVGKQNTTEINWLVSSPNMQQIILILFVSVIATSCKIPYQFKIWLWN